MEQSQDLKKKERKNTHPKYKQFGRKKKTWKTPRSPVSSTKAPEGTRHWRGEKDGREGRQ